MEPNAMNMFIPEMGDRAFHSVLENTSDDSNLTTSSILTSLSPNTTELPVQSKSPCKWILYFELNDSRVRIWDLIILIPNACFLFFLLVRLRTALVKLQRTNSPIFLAFYGLMFLVAVISVLRCVVSMTVNAAVKAGDIADKVLWLVLRFFLLATELSVVIFGLAFGHLDSKTSIRRVLLVTFAVSLVYSSVQGVLEFLYPDDYFHVKHGTREFDIFGHGGMMFWFASSLFFFVVYTVICILPFTKLKERFALPSKKSFYWYCAFLAILNAIQATGSGLLYYKIESGLCVVDVTTYIYFTCYAPLVYFTFLRDFFRSSHTPDILFSYKAQTDEDDDVNLPSQRYAKPGEPIPDEEEMYDSTHFSGASPNPLYRAEGGSSPLPGDFPYPPGLAPQLSINFDYFGEHESDRQKDTVVIT